MSFYELNAINFSKTRVFPWPSTKDFIDEIPTNSEVLDIGCGNGRNMFYRKDIKVTGLELSKSLCELVKNKGGRIINGNMVSLPFKDNSFDYILCIAAYHHLENKIDRKNSIKEIYRVLKPNGKVFIQVWAMEQPFCSRRKFLKRNENVSWKNKDGKVFYRYYHIYPKGELEKELIDIEPKFKIEKIIFEEGNWINILKK